MKHSTKGEIMRNETNLARGAQALWLGIASMLLAACSSPEFANPPPDKYLAPLPAAINGTWANEVENGERVRLAGQQDGTLKLFFSQAKPTSEPPPKEPLLAQTMHFDNADWILIDFRQVAAWQGEKYTEKFPFRLLRFELQTPDRLCGTELGVSVFADAVKSGQLEGKAVFPPARPPQGMGMMAQPPAKVTVTSPGEAWVNWWIALPPEQKKFGPTWCFVRAK
jgi:hypothetical protein